MWCVCVTYWKGTWFVQDDQIFRQMNYFYGLGENRSLMPVSTIGFGVLINRVDPFPGKFPDPDFGVSRPIILVPFSSMSNIFYFWDLIFDMRL